MQLRTYEKLMIAAGLLALVIFIAIGYNNTYPSDLHHGGDIKTPAEIGAWRMDDASASRTRFADAPVIKKPCLAWYRKIPDCRLISEVVFCGAEYPVYTSSRGDLTVLDADGNKLWSKVVRGVFERDGFCFTPAVLSSGNIIISDTENRVRTYSITGDLVRSFTTEYCNGTSILVSEESLDGCQLSERFLFAGDDRQWLADQEGDGLIMGLYINIAINEHLDYIFISNSDEHVFGNAETGETFRSRPNFSYQEKTPMALAENTILTSSSGSYGAYDYQGNRSWSNRLEGNDSVILSRAADRLGNIYLSTKHRVLKISPEGETLWTVSFKEELNWDLTAVNNEALVITDDDMNIYCLGSQTGRELWRFKAGDSYWVTRLSIAPDGAIYVSAIGDGIYCIRDKAS